jgi:hypothetical protein
MFRRTYWIERIFDSLSRRNVLWLSGVRRVGKTTLCQSLTDTKYFDCELPRVRQALEDAELFFRKQGSGVIVLDEIHRLMNPSEVLKIAADHFPSLQVIATGSSTLAARRKFRDSLSGRKEELWLTPLVIRDLRDFQNVDIEARMLKGGLPALFLSGQLDDKAYAEWLDSYWAKDLEELFVVERKSSFFKFVELLFRQSGELFDAQSFSAPCEISRQTVHNYLQILETTLLATVLRPYSGNTSVELKSRPKVYAFDTGFVCYLRGWESLRDEDRGHLLEHLTLNELLIAFPRTNVFYWRDKQKHELDFVVKDGRGHKVTAIECKVKPDKFTKNNLKIFRKLHPKGRNLVVCLDLLERFERRYDEMVVEFLPFFDLPEAIGGRG